MKWTPAIALFAVCAFAQKPDKPLKNGLYAIFETGVGNFTAQLYEKDTPISVKQFVGLAQGTVEWKSPQSHTMVGGALYNNTVFYRVLPKMAIQGGSPTGSAVFDCGTKIKDEFLPGYTFAGPGMLAMANSNTDSLKNTGGCQFFVTSAPVTSWNGQYAIFGEVVSGLDVVTKINNAPVQGDKPVDPVKLISVKIQRVGPEPVVKVKK